MKNFIFKSPQDFHKIVFNKLDMVLAELRHQRQDSVQILFLLNKLLVDNRLQKQVDEYFNEDEKESFSETSPQTDLEDK